MIWTNAVINREAGRKIDKWWMKRNFPWTFFGTKPRGEIQKGDKGGDWKGPANLWSLASTASGLSRADIKIVAVLDLRHLETEPENLEWNQITKIQQWKGCNPLGENLISQLLLELGGWDADGEDLAGRGWELAIFDEPRKLHFEIGCDPSHLYQRCLKVQLGRHLRSLWNLNNSLLGQNLPFLLVD